ncbi:hypothetical protein NKH77_12925 [Streptomyces sp. M19]
MLINSERQAKSLGRPVIGGFIELTGTSPKAKGTQPEPVPPPDHSDIGPHMAYAVQWWLFSAGVPAGWIVLVRRERKDRLEQAAKKAAPEEKPRAVQAAAASE